MNANITTADTMVGTPEIDSNFFPGQQSYPDTCAIRCQEFILQQFLGLDIEEGAIVQEAIDNGWYSPGSGTSLENVGNLLELYGIEVNRIVDANIYNLVDELAQGHKVIVGVDSGELWNKGVIETTEDMINISGADHAITVLGIDTSDLNNIQVIVGDPGTGEAAAKYPIDQFIDAWRDSSFYMVSTQEAAPFWNEGMENFNYEVGHVEQLGSFSYEEIQFKEENNDYTDEEDLENSINNLDNENTDEAIEGEVDDLEELEDEESTDYIYEDDLNEIPSQDMERNGEDFTDLNMIDEGENLYNTYESNIF